MSGYAVHARRLVGDRPELVPGQSAFGLVARLARLNQLGPGDLHCMFGLHIRRSDDLSQMLALSERHQKALADSLQQNRLATWHPRLWHPFKGGPPDLALAKFRYCMGCIRVGYHPMLHQMPWITSCPWHGVRLRSGCPRCGRGISVSGDTGRKLLTCECGFDLLNESAAARLAAPPRGATDAINLYLHWASVAQEEWRLVGSGDVPLRSTILASLVASAFGGFQQREPDAAGRCHTRRYGTRDQGGQVKDGAWPHGLTTDCPQLLELPESWGRSVRAVAHNLARKLPPESLTLQEQLLFLGAVVRDSVTFKPADRPTSGTVRCLPPFAAGSRQFLDLSSVHPVVVRTIAALESWAVTASEAETPSNEARANARLAHRVAGDLLCRSYAEGLRTVLSRYVPALYGLGRDRPHLSAAWALARTRPPGEIRVAFARIDVQQAPPDVLSSARAQRGQ